MTNNFASGFNSPTFTYSNTNYNFNPAISFNGSNTYFDVTDGFDNFDSGTNTFSVARFTNTNNYARIYDFGNGQSSNNILLSRVSTTAAITYEQYTGATSRQVLAT